MVAPYALVEQAVACLVAEFAAAEPDVASPGFIGPVPGAVLVADYIGVEGECEGMAWVRLTSSFQSLVLPNSEATPRATAFGSQAFSFEMGTLRCTPEVSEVYGQVELPTPEAQATATELQLADMQIMRRAILCCMKGREFVLGDYTPMGPEGAALGGYWSFVVSAVG